MATATKPKKVKTTLTTHERLCEFIRKNDLIFEEGNRNSDAVTISGYALHIGVKYSSDIEDAIDEVLPDASSHDYEDELKRVFDYAKDNHYERFWETEQARSMYTF